MTIMSGVFDQGSSDATIIADEPAPFLRQGIQIVNAIQAGTEPIFVPFQKHGPFPLPVAKYDPGRGFPNGLLDQPGGNSNPVSVHPSTGARAQIRPDPVKRARPAQAPAA